MRPPKSTKAIRTRSKKPPSTRSSTLMALPVRTRSNRMKLAKSKIENIMNVRTYKTPTTILHFPPSKTPVKLTNKSAAAIIYRVGENRVLKVLRDFPPAPKMVKEYKKLQVLGNIGISPKVYRIGLWQPSPSNQPLVAIEQQALDGDIEELLLRRIPKLPIDQQKKVKASFCSKLKLLLDKIWKVGLYHGDLHHGNIMYTLDEKTNKLKLYLIDVETVHTNKYKLGNRQLKEIDIGDTFKNKQTWMKAPIHAWMKSVCKFDKQVFDRSFSRRTIKANEGKNNYDALMKYMGHPSYRRANLNRLQSLRPLSALSNTQLVELVTDEQSEKLNENNKKRLSLRPITPNIKNQ